VKTIKENKKRKIKLLAFCNDTYISSLVVVVLAHQFFDIHTEEALAAFYQIPYYSGLFLIKRLIDRWID
jgi:hypothetical protein